MRNLHDVMETTVNSKAMSTTTECRDTMAPAPRRTERPPRVITLGSSVQPLAGLVKHHITL